MRQRWDLNTDLSWPQARDLATFPLVQLRLLDTGRWPEEMGEMASVCPTQVSSLGQTRASCPTHLLQRGLTVPPANLGFVRTSGVRAFPLYLSCHPASQL